MEFQEGLISVIMSNYNTPADYLEDSIQSVINQTYTNFEFIIIDDCSTDNSLEIIESYKDDRIVIIKNEENLGITKSLNKGLKLAKGEFVARMDTDDICLPTRFEKQVDFLSKNKQLIVCGTGIEVFGDKEKTVIKNIPEKEEFKIHQLFGNQINIIHPTAMFRHNMLSKNLITYDEQYKYAQDYKMWVTCNKFGECANVPEVLLKYRVHNKAISSDKKNAQKDCAKRIIEEQLRQLSLKLPDNWEEIHYGFLTEDKPYNISYRHWIKKIISQNKKHKIYNQQKLEQILWGRWMEISHTAFKKKKNLFRSIKIILTIPVKYWKNFFTKHYN